MDYRTIAGQAAQKYGLDPGIFTKQINAESGFNPAARSPAGAQGIAQIMPATARAWGVNPADPVASLHAAAKNMAQYVKQYGSYRDALVAYNAGPGRVGGPLPAETQNYVRSILGGSSGPPPGKPVVASAATAKSSKPAVSSSPSDGPQRAALISQFLNSKNADPVTFALGIRGLNQQAAPAVRAPTAPVVAPATSGAPAPGGGYKVARLDGKQVAAWMLPALQYARSHGWNGTITSGVRTRAEQAQLYQRYLQGGNIAAKPGQSNHEVENGGAVDVTNPAALAAALRGFTGRKPIQGTAIGDPVHFSATGR